MPVLRDFQLQVRRGEFLALVGASGCGKTTLLRMIAGLDLDYSGAILVGGQPVRGPRRQHAIAFQEPRLLPWMTAEENIGFALPRNTPQLEYGARVARALEQTGLVQHRNKLPRALSGGMSARVALARALIGCPELFLLDEPFASLDAKSTWDLQELVVALHAELGATFILVTHDIAEAVYLSDRVVVLDASPGPLVHEMRVDLPRPRRREALEYTECCAEVLMSLNLNVEARAREERH